MRRSKPDTSLTVLTEEMVYSGLETGDIADIPLGYGDRGHG
jgi:hypothetical protein